MLFRYGLLYLTLYNEQHTNPRGLISQNLSFVVRVNYVKHMVSDAYHYKSENSREPRTLAENRHWLRYR